MSRKEILVQNLNLNAISDARTEFVRTTDVNFETKRGRLTEAKFLVCVNVIGLDWASPNFHKRASHYTIRFSSELTINIGERAFPFAGKTKAELEALNEYCLLLRELLGLDREYVAPRDEFPPTEIEELRAQLKSVQDENWKLKVQINNLEKE